MTLTLLLLVTTAQAKWPEDVSISGMLDHGGQRITAPVTGDYTQLVRELGTAVANKAIAPAITLGSFGFDVSLSNSFVFITAQGDRTDPSPWQRAVPDENPSAMMFVPTMTIRKGFAGSTEFGTTAGWVGMTRQGVFSGFARVGLLEGFNPAPDLSVQLGYSGYLGNNELNLGVMDFSVRLGQVIPFGALPGIHTAQFSPWIDYTALRISASPHIAGQDQSLLGIKQFGYSADGTSDPALLLHRFSLGFQVTNGAVHFRAVGSLTSNSSPSVNVGVGFTY